MSTKNYNKYHCHRSGAESTMTASPRTKLDVYWHKMSPLAKIPSKRDEDAGYDIYTIENNIILMPSERHLFDSGLQYYINSKNYFLSIWDRGSSGSNGVCHRCGVIDSGFRGRIFVCISNDNSYPIKFTSDVSKIEFKDNASITLDSGEIYVGPVLFYPTSKAIAQAILTPVPQSNSKEINDDEWNNIINNDECKRGCGELGSSGK